MTVLIIKAVNKDKKAKRNFADNHVHIILIIFDS